MSTQNSGALVIMFNSFRRRQGMHCDRTGPQTLIFDPVLKLGR